MHPPGHLIAARYEVLGSLGTGGQGDVYTVQDHTEGDEVALKILDPNALTAMGPWEEAQILRRLTDHHILPIRNAFAFAGQPIIVTEIARHGSIDTLINASPLGLPVADAIRWTRQACQALTRAHELGLVHNDIKPANLFLDHRNDCRVGDFGFAGRIDPATNLAPVYGATFQTMAPEVAATWPTSPGSPGPHSNQISDVYSLAATAYWMLTGQPTIDPTAFPNFAALTAHITTTEAPKIRDTAPHVPDPIARIIDSALALNTLKRPQTTSEFGAALGRALPGRRWERTDIHPAHLACWRGSPPGTGSTLIMCMTPGTKPSQRLLHTVYERSGRKVPHGEATATRATWPAAVRKLMRLL